VENLQEELDIALISSPGENKRNNSNKVFCLAIEDIEFKRETDSPAKILQACSISQIEQMQKFNNAHSTKPLIMPQKIKFSVDRRMVI
jgi:hypothetical protein